MDTRSVLINTAAAGVAVLGIASVSPAQVRWTAQPSVAWPGDPGEWDDGGHAVGSVVYDGSRYYMYLIGGHDMTPGSSWSVGLWTSVDCIHWYPELQNPVFWPGEPGSWDDHSIVGLAVTYGGGLFRMWYGGMGSDGVVHVGLATSPNGHQWTRWTSYPLEGLEPGPPGAWDDGGLTPHTVLEDGRVYHMWFTGSSAGQFRIGYARSVDGISWSRVPAPVLESEGSWDKATVHTPAVVRSGEGFAMWYSGGSPEAAIGYAFSANGAEWEAWPGNPVLRSGTPGCGGIGSAAVLGDAGWAFAWFEECLVIGSASSYLELVSFSGFENAGWTQRPGLPHRTPLAAGRPPSSEIGTRGTPE